MQFENPEVKSNRERLQHRSFTRCFIAEVIVLLMVGMVCLGLLMLAGCGSRSIDYSAEGFHYSNVGQDTAFGALDVTRRTTTETVDPETGAVVSRVIEETTVKVDAYEGADAAAAALRASAEALKEVAGKLP